MRYLAGICALVLAGCSSYQGPESFESKMAHFQASSATKNMVPEFKTLPVTIGRTPASTFQVSRETATLSNKRLYFSTLYDQYEELKQMTQLNSPGIQRCPNFHSGLVASKVRSTTVKTFNWPDMEQYLTNQEKASVAPEMQLPMTEADIRPKIIDVFTSNKNSKSLSELLKEGVAIHLNKMHAELEELCEHGNSDNYYAFENLITSISDNKLAPAQEGAATLMKTTLVSNMALMNSLSRWVTQGNRSPASVSGMQAEKSKQMEIFRRLHTPWAADYLSQYRQR